MGTGYKNDISVLMPYSNGGQMFQLSNGVLAATEGVRTITGGKWNSSTILTVLKNEKYKGDAKLQKTYHKDHLHKKKCINRGELESYYIEDNHSPIVTKEVWEEAQRQIALRAEARGNDDNEKHQNRYPLTGMLLCSKCGASLRRRTWNSIHACKKVVWQCSTYINEGKKSCSGTVIEDAVIERMNIRNKTVIEEVMKNGEKHYRYTCKANRTSLAESIELKKVAAYC